MSNGFSIRHAEPADLDTIIGFIHALADYERMTDEVEITPELARRWLFEEKRAEVLIGELDGDAIGFALFFTSFSTFVGRPGIYLEDLFIKPEHRGGGYGTAFLGHLARLTVERGYGRLEWACLDWNKPSIGFYLSLGAQPMDEWTTYRLAGDALLEVAEQA